MNNRRCNLRIMLKRVPNSEGVECASDYFDVDIQVLRTWGSSFTLSVGCTYGYSHSSPSGLRNISYKTSFGRFYKYYGVTHLCVTSVISIA